MASATPTLDTQVLIIGAGFSGLAMAIDLQKRGIDCLILEKGAEVGGTWRDNTYPGAACDVPSHLYCYSFEPKRWTRSFAAQPEILDYMQAVSVKYQLRPLIRFDCEVTHAAYDDASSTWQVNCHNGKRYRARFVVSARGALHIPQYPKIAGRDTFKGITMHSARWDHRVDLKGKRIAVIGTGASAIQIIPKMAKIASELYVVQRTPAWVVPKPDYAYREDTKNKYEHHPIKRWMYRNKLYWTLEFNATGFLLDPRLMKFGKKFALKNLNKVNDEDLRAKLTPSYTLGCKRILMSNKYYPVFNQPHVQLLQGAVDAMNETGVCVNGQWTDVDVVIFCTGFDVTNQAEHFDISGRGGVAIKDHWAKGMHAYLGICSHQFPNAFFLLGPNTGLGHNSIIFMIESQVRYVGDALSYLIDQHASSIEVDAQIEAQYVAEMRQRTQGSVWQAGGCASWYLDQYGQNTTLWPSFTFNYWLRTRVFDPTVFNIQSAQTNHRKPLISRILDRA